MISVKVCYKSSGRPCNSAKVTISFDGLLRGTSKTLYSDSDGMCHFDNDPGKGTVYVNGSSRHTGRIQGITVVYI